LATGNKDQVGAMVKERWTIVASIDVTLHALLESFYEQLSLSTSQQPFSASTNSSILNMSIASASVHHTFLRPKGVKRLEGDGEVRRHVERLLLRLDFNGGFSKPRTRKASKDEEDILKGGGL